MVLYQQIDKPIIGVIGGMGPEATITFQIELLHAMHKHLKVSRDQDYYRVLIDNNSQIPDRHEAFFENGKSPVSYLKKSLKLLEHAKVSIVAMPCNAAHIYYDEIQQHTKIPIINMIKETANTINKSCKEITKIGLLSTLGVGRLKLYHNILANYGIEVVMLDNDLAQDVHDVIYNIKGKGQEIITLLKNDYNYVFIKLKKALDYFKMKEVSNVILGCTELSMSMKQQEFPDMNLIDPMNILANRVVESAIKIEQNSFS